MTSAYIIDHVRTPRARRKGKFAGIHAADLLTYPLNALKDRQGFDPASIEDVVVGCVTQVSEQGWCVGRKSVLAAGWPVSVPATTVNRLCGSGQQACNFVASTIMAGNCDYAIGAGLEHMTRVPMFSDCTGGESPMLAKIYPDLVPQGLSAEMVAESFKISRNELDQFSFESHQRANKARAEGRFAKSIIPVPYTDEQGAAQQLASDDNIRPDTTVEALGQLKTVFKEGGVITAGNASAIVDGAAAVLLASERKVKELNLKPRARIVSMAAIGSPPKIMLPGPIEVSRMALKRAGLQIKDIDLWKINEAFAPVPIATYRELEIDPALVNVNGGGIALGHPLGATGCMLLGTAIDELERTGKRRALITMCIGLGMGIATIIERT